VLTFFKVAPHTVNCGVTTKYLMKLALDRKGPKSAKKDKEKLMASGDLSETVATIINAAKVLEETEHEQVEIIAQDGTALVGHWYCPENAKRIIVAMHGWRSNWSQDFGTIAPFWFDNDCAVLFAEQRGQGNSGGDYMGFGLLERYDCLDWINWVNERTEGKLPIYLGGVSMGATTILMTTGFELPENVQGIVADCGFTSPKDILASVFRSVIHLPALPTLWATELFARAFAGFSLWERSTEKSLANSRVPVLLIHGKADDFVPCEMTERSYAACKEPKKLLIVENAGHGVSFLVDHKRYIAYINEFLKKTLKKEV